ncbi:MAG TPA: hypothetical protein VEU30_02470 [Thermoanaerobaculia bacterium]|nr:hypothetical protein [Thermoanaerobaculia bacterium]
MTVLRRVGAGAAIAAVLLGYVYFATGGSMRFQPAPTEPRGWDNPGGGYYAQLAEGFRRGHTYLPFAPDPRMATLVDPYDYGQRDAAGISYLWDASWYRGRYHLYFTPLPVVFFYLPYHWIAGEHADDAAAAVFFSAWTFVAAVLFVWKARSRILWIAFVGFANLIPFALSSARVYEVAILCATALSATWAVALLRFEEKPSVRAAAWMSLWLSLAIAARPNLIVLLLPTALVLWRQERVLRMRAAIAVAIPLMLAGAGYAGYNMVRFGSPLESGITYQLTYVPMRGLSRCSCKSVPEVVRFVSNSLQYTFTPPRLVSDFPHVQAATAHIDKRVSWPGGEPEEILGIVPMVPLTLAATAVALLLLARRQLRAGPLILGGAWLVLFTLSTCWWIVSRYAFDFQILMLLGTVACIEEVRTKALRLLIIALAIYSIVVGILLGFEGRGGAFRAHSPMSSFQSSGWSRMNAVISATHS